MIHIYYTSYEKQLEESAYVGYINQMPQKIKENILRYRRWQDQHASLLGKLLLMKGLNDFNIDLGLEDLCYNKYGRPYFNNPLDFNISHSGFMVACAFSTSGKIGLDLEEVKEMEIEDFKGQFNNIEWSLINSSANKHEQFYSFWTIKEAVIKGDGKGLSIPLKEVRIEKEKVKVGSDVWYIKNVGLKNDYISHLASANEINSEVISSKILF